MTSDRITGAIAFAAGGLLSLMVLFNGTLAQHGSLLFASWVPHATGTLAALVFLMVLRPRKAGAKSGSKAPLWAYTGGLFGAVTVMLTSATLNTPLALSGTIALGLAGQLAFSLLADATGLMGLAKRRLIWRDMAAVVLVSAGSLVLIFEGAA